MSCRAPRNTYHGLVFTSELLSVRSRCSAVVLKNGMPYLSAKRRTYNGFDLVNVLQENLDLVDSYNRQLISLFQYTMYVTCRSIPVSQRGRKSAMKTPKLFCGTGKPRRAARVGAISDCSTVE